MEQAMEYFKELSYDLIGHVELRITTEYISSYLDCRPQQLRMKLEFPGTETFNFIIFGTKDQFEAFQILIRTAE